MKTVLEYSERMPRGLRIRYLKNVSQRNGVAHMFVKYRNFNDAVNHTMCWADTPEGYEFWGIICEKGIKKAYSQEKFRSYFKKP